MPELELSGVGAYTWQTGSGYVGLTVMFWDDQSKEFLSWSYARPEIHLVVVLEPREFGGRAFDEIAQVFRWEVYDEIDRELTLTLPFRNWTKESIKILEQLSPPKDQHWRFIVKLALEEQQLIVEPISILRAEDRERPVFHLAFDSLTQPGDARVAGIAREDDDEFEAEEEESLEPELSGIGSLSKVLSEINRRLEAIAETGLQTGLAAHREWFTKSEREVHAFGLTVLAKLLAALSRQSSLPAPS